jgi:hypothetical protein
MSRLIDRLFWWYAFRSLDRRLAIVGQAYWTAINGGEFSKVWLM